MLNTPELKRPEHPITTHAKDPTAALACRFLLGDWLICPELNRLQHRRSTLQRAIEPRLMHLLCFLAANPERVLSRDELVQELWPRVIVNENSLTRAMSELRKNLSLSDGHGHAYIETIPKRGYRLLQAVEFDNAATRSPEPLSPQPRLVIQPEPVMAYALEGRRQTLRHAVGAFCLSLLFGSWIGLQSSDLLVNPAIPPQLLADEVLTTQPSYLGGELTLSTANDAEVMKNDTRNVEPPVVSNDASQYAYIQHDNSGSTIFLGRMDPQSSPVVAVYNSPQHLFNLTWSPVGNSLIFARQTQLTSAALFLDDRNSAELVMLDLTSLEVQRLLPDTNPASSGSGKPQNLT